MGRKKVVLMIITLIVILLYPGGMHLRAEDSNKVELSSGFKIYCIENYSGLSSYSGNNKIPESQKSYLVGNDDIRSVQGLSWDSSTSTLTFDGYNGGPVYVGSSNAVTLDKINIVIKGDNIIHGLPGCNSDSVNSTFTLAGIDAQLSGVDGADLHVECEYSDGAGYGLNVYGSLAVKDSHIIISNSSNPFSVTKVWTYDSSTYREDNLGGALSFKASDIEIKDVIPTVKAGHAYYVQSSAIYSDGNINIDNSSFDINLGWTDEESTQKPLGIFYARESITGKNVEIKGIVDFRVGNIPTFFVSKGVNNLDNDTSKINIENETNNVKIDISTASPELTPDWFKYDGNPHTPQVLISGLTQGTDYKIDSVSDNVDPGKATITISGIGKYTGKCSSSFYITNDTTAPNINKDKDNLVYTGKEYSLLLDDLSSEDTHYYVSEAGDKAVQKNAGNYKTVLSLKEGYRWTDNTVTDKVIEWKIARKQVTIKGVKIRDKYYDYNKVAEVESVDFDGCVEGDTLNIGSDYLIRSATFESENAADSVPVTVYMSLSEQGNYTFKDSSGKEYLSQSVAGSARIKRVEILYEDVQILDGEDALYYTGKHVEPRVSVPLGLGGKELIEGEDYTVSYENNLGPASGPDDAAQVIIKGINNYEGECSKIYYIMPNGLRPVFAEINNESVEGKGDGSIIPEVEYVEDGDVLLYKAPGDTEFKTAEDNKLTGLKSGKYILKWNSYNESLFKGIEETEVEIGFDEHDWSEATYTWSSDKNGDWVTAKRVCKADSSHVETEKCAMYSNKTDATCTADGKIEYFSQEFVNKAFKKQTKTETIPATGHKWDKGKVTKEATKDAEGEKLYTCDKCGATRKEKIPKKTDSNESNNGIDNQKNTDSDKSDKNSDNVKGKDGTAFGNGASLALAEKTITSLKSDADPKGSVFNILKLRAKKVSKNSITLNWTKAKGASGYIIYGNKCGKKNKYVKLATLKKTSKKINKIGKTKITKGKYYKFILIAVDKNNKVISTSKTVHVATTGGKFGNYSKVNTVAKKNKVTIKVKKKFKLKAKAVASSKKIRVNKHRSVQYESTNPKIAVVNKKGVITGKKKGTCYVYAYSQSGVTAKIKVTVK